MARIRPSFERQNSELQSDCIYTIFVPFETRVEEGSNSRHCSLCVAVRCTVLQCFGFFYFALQCVAVPRHLSEEGDIDDISFYMLQSVAVFGIVLLCIAIVESALEPLYILKPIHMCDVTHSYV